MSEPAPASAQSGRDTGRAQLLLLAVVTLLALWPLCGGEFTSWDDKTTVANNPTLNPPTLQSLKVWWTTANLDLWDPVTDMLRGALAKVGTTESPDPVTGTKLNPYVYHSANLLLHIAAVLIVYQILVLVLVRARSAGFSPYLRDQNGLKPALRTIRWAACAGALLFAVHPLQVETVGWVTAMKDLLCGLLCLAALWRYLIYTDSQAFQSRDREGAVLVELRTSSVKQTNIGKSNPHRLLTRAALKHKRAPTDRSSERKSEFWIATFLFLLATLSKPTAVVLPAVALVLTHWVLGRPFRQVWRGMLLWAVLALPCIIVTQLVQPAIDTGAVALWRRPLVAADALAFYLYKLVWPASLGLDYGRRPDWIFQHGFAWWTWLAPATIAILLWIFRRRAPLLVAAAMIFVLGLLPVLGLVRFDFQRFSTVSDHYLYLSMFAVALAAAWGVTRLRRPRLAAVGIGFIVAALGLRSWHQTRVWQNSETLFVHAIEVNPASAAAYSSLAELERGRGMNPQAEAFARESVRLRPDLAPGWVTLGAVYEQEGRLDEAIAAARGACAAEPDVAVGFTNLSLLLARKGQLAEAEAMARRAVELEPDNAEAHAHLGLLEAQRGHLDMGVRDLQEAVTLDPNNLLAQTNLGALLAREGRRDEAISHLKAALRIDPNFPTARRDLAHLTGGNPTD